MKRQIIRLQPEDDGYDDAEDDGDDDGEDDGEDGGEDAAEDDAEDDGNADRRIQNLKLTTGCLVASSAGELGGCQPFHPLHLIIVSFHHIII